MEDKNIGEIFARKGLVVFQFALSTILIISVLIIYSQIEFVQSKNLGYSKDNVIYFEKEGNISHNEDVFLSEIKKVAGVVNASSCGSNLIGSYSSTEGLNWEGKNPDDIIRFEYVPVNYDLIETLGLQIIQGRSFSKEFGSEDTKVIFNEAAINVMGLSNSIGKTVNVWGNEKQIIGVVKDFHYESLHEKIKPLLFVLYPPHTLKIMVKIRGGQEGETISRTEKLYSKFNPGIPFDFKFLDQDFQSQYEAEKRVSLLSRYFAGLAIVISCLGLFGLVAFSAEQRTKEIGIRKVLGANFGGLILLLSKDFLKLVFIAFIIASPVAWYFMNIWLDDFEYRINISLWMFILSGGIALVIALLTIGYQAIKAATANPVEALRYE